MWSNLSLIFNRPMKNSDINLMDDNQNEWGEEDPDCRRFRVRLAIWNIWFLVWINYILLNFLYHTYWYWSCDVVQFEEQAMLDLSDNTDHRKWTQQHLDAADLRIPSIAPTPPQGEIENDCMDVNVRGPGAYKKDIVYRENCKLLQTTEDTRLGTLYDPCSSSFRWFHSPDDRLL